MIKIKRALISVSDKTSIVELAKTLNAFGVEILSTGGTAKLLRDKGIAVKDVSDYTGFPEILDGRVKTLHPKIHGGLLAVRQNPEHIQKLESLGIGLIDMAVVNLYPFEKAVQKPGVAEEEAIENIDIGGPSMLRSAAKNFCSVVVVSSVSQYPSLIKELEETQGCVSEKTARGFAAQVFKSTAQYDEAIYQYLSKKAIGGRATNTSFPAKLELSFTKIQDLRYGENPHQAAAFYRDQGALCGMASLRQVQGKELSFNNILDLNSAWELLKEFLSPAAVIVKHNNPCGVAEAKDITKAYQEAFAGDPLSAFGGIVGLNRQVDAKAARVIVESGFLECIIAPGFDRDALKVFSVKKNLRVLELKDIDMRKDCDFKKVSGGLLLQDKDLELVRQEDLKTVTRKKPTQAQLNSLLFAWKVAKHVKSNAIVLAKGTKTIGIGAGQSSRVDSVIIAKTKAGKNTINSCLASDGFFPKPDSILEAAKKGVRAIIQPGGSIADPEIIKACDKHTIAMVLTGVRHFKH
ncbi:MAG: bifunctional phosphoribosylaminoimidazolecarboxamide formyltransferase/IMP cyclohydrolase [Candidatus Omnitrophota bacterium]|jgi:phosphoribosylaminoimidazolecarboxamide formyltransferase/IMP cyclohydrolase